MHLKVQVGACTIASATHFTNLLGLPDALALLYVERIHVGIAGHAAIRVPNLDHIAIATWITPDAAA
jgi:hypothetical protein